MELFSSLRAHFAVDSHFFFFDEDLGVTAGLGDAAEFQRRVQLDERRADRELLLVHFEELYLDFSYFFTFWSYRIHNIILLRMHNS